MSALAPNPALAHQKQYVFVDEYNRHKRLKVMRACDGCRKRKIRCDGALQNGPWPCGACTRLKLKCLPPTLDPDDEPDTPDSATSQNSFVFPSLPAPTSNPVGNPTSNPAHISPTSHPGSEWNGTPGTTILTPLSTNSAGPTSHPDFDLNTGAYLSRQYPFTPQLSNSYTQDDYFLQSTEQASYPHAQPVSKGLFRTDTIASDTSSGDPHEINAAVHELSGRMGDMMIDVTSAAPYITNHRRPPGDTPAVDDRDVVLPPCVFTDAAVRIPVEMMPSEERALDYFGYYFDHVHPYVPVLNRSAFYDQWHTARATISPLILEAIFASVACFIEPAIDARKWLALAAKHEESFRDVPRLSTIQAIIILMKARESYPKPGYYYRSWMSVRYMVSMGKDLDLHEHYDLHRDGQHLCASSPSECTIKTRVWQCLHVLEIMVGAPQGRSDFSIDTDTVQLTIPDQPDQTNQDDAFERQMTRRTTYIAQAVSNIKQSYQLCLKIRRRRKDWALDPEFTQHNEDIPTWLRELPSDVQIHYSDDTSPPFLGGDHWLASLHAYHHLMIIMHHRPQLQAMLEKGDPNFRYHLETCLDSAIKMCRLQEALHRDFGLHGLQFMLRGINFTVYCVLTCTILHLAAITAPDPALNTQARTFFTRHMRILELCLSSSSPEMVLQINTLRQAFSADTSKPFELKGNLGLKSPSPRDPTPPETHADRITNATFTAPAWGNQIERGVVGKNLTPISDYGGSSLDDIAPDVLATAHPTQSSLAYLTDPTTYPLSMTQHHHQSYQPPTSHTASMHNMDPYALKPTLSNDHPPLSQQDWDPSGIFSHWNTAFGGGAAVPPSQPIAIPQPQQTSLSPTSGNIIALQHSQQQQQQQQLGQSPTASYVVPGVMQSPPNSVLHHSAVAAAGAGLANTAADPHFNKAAAVTAGMWQDVFTNAFVSGHGVKRYRQASLEHHSPYDLGLAKRRG